MKLILLLAIVCFPAMIKAKISSFVDFKSQISHQQDPLKALKTKGCKVVITGNDANAQIHLRRELEFFDVWMIKSNASDAEFEIKLLTKKSGIANADRDVRIVITDLKSGKEVYASPIVNGTEYGFKTVNLKEAAVKNLVENEIRQTFFK